MTDLVIVGGGAIGMSIAWELAEAGLRICILDQSEPGQEASWAGAGMIPPGDLNDEATHQLAVLSAQRWPELSAALKAETGIDNGYHRCGAMLIEEGKAVDSLSRAWRDLHVTTEILTREQLQERNPAISPEIEQAVWLPDQSQVRNPHHVNALRIACQKRGVEFHSQQKVVSWEHRNGRILAAITPQERYPAAEFLVAAGAWSSQPLSELGIPLEVEPVHGQIVLLRAAEQMFSQIIEQGRRYLVPRKDGRVLIGATEERIEFQKRNTDEVVQQLRSFARSLVPALAELPVEKAWSGLRPWNATGRPTLGRTQKFQNLIVAAGHYRAGISNSPGTAIVLRQLVMGEPPTIDLAAFACSNRDE